MTISAITIPIKAIPSVEPTFDSSSGRGVAVGCMKKAPLPGFPLMSGGVENVNAALNNARPNPSPIVMMERIRFFMFFRVYHVLIRSLPSSICTCTCF
jgi:hypothetical protein